MYNEKQNAVEANKKKRRRRVMNVKKERREHKEDDKIIMDKLDVTAVEIQRFLENKTEFSMTSEELTTALTGRQRLRLYGAGPKNLGFINKAFDVAAGNPNFTPRGLDVENFRGMLGDFKNMCQLVLELRQFLQTAENIALLESDALYRMALRVYRTLQEMNDARIQGAETLFKALREYFRRPKNNSGGPTQKELERDFKKVLHGEASGEIKIVSESPALKAGKRKVIDRVGKSKRVVKVTGEEGGGT
jgi:hypothetical protein